MSCITESVVTVNILWQRLTWEAQNRESITSQRLTDYQPLSFSSSFSLLPNENPSFLKAHYCCSSNTQGGEDISDGIPVKSSHTDQKAVDKHAENMEVVSDKAGEAKWKDKECHRMLRKAAVYQG